MGTNHTDVLSYGALKEELLVFLRNNVTDPSARGTTGSDVFTAGGASGNFTLSQVGVKNITSVTVSSAAKTAYVDYTPNYQNTSPSSNPTVAMAAVPASGAQVQVNYKYGDTWIYPDWPRTDLGLNAYPRIAVDILSKRTKPFGIGGKVTISDIMVSMAVFADKASTIDTLMTQIGSSFIANTTSFYNFQAVYPDSMSSILNEPDRNDKILFQTQDLIILSRVEK